MKRFACLILFMMISIPCNSIAETKIVYAEHKYVMGDNDSKNDARRMCFLEAKRKVLEKAGTYIESRTEVKNYKLTQDEIITYSAALLKVETVKEQWGITGEHMAIEISVKAEVDTGYIEKQLAKIKGNTSVQKKIKDQQNRLQELEATVIKLQKQLGAVSASEAAPLRKERNVVFKRIDTLEAKRIEIVTRVQKRSRDARKYITEGMNKDDVLSLLGKPDGSLLPLRSYSENIWYYGKTKGLRKIKTTSLRAN